MTWKVVFSRSLLTTHLTTHCSHEWRMGLNEWLIRTLLLHCGFLMRDHSNQNVRFFCIPFQTCSQNSFVYNPKYMTRLFLSSISAYVRNGGWIMGWKKISEVNSNSLRKRALARQLKRAQAFHETHFFVRKPTRIPVLEVFLCVALYVAFTVWLRDLYSQCGWEFQSCPAVGLLSDLHAFRSFAQL